jgi:Xaa-Pro dipeptidase
LLTLCAADNLLITEDGYENLTPTPKEVEDINKIVKGA